MVTIQEARNHFDEKYKNNEFGNPSLTATNEKLLWAYEKEMYINKEENEIFENGTNLYFMNFPENQQQEIKQFVKENDMYTYNYEYQRIDYVRPRIENNRIMYLPEKFVSVLESQFNVEKEKVCTVLGNEEIKNYKVGQKVKLIDMESIFNDIEHGTVISNDDELIIRKYRTKNKGWKYSAGDIVKIEKIDSFKR